MAAFVQDDINKDPAVGQWVHLQLRKLATSSGACVLINHHMSKTKEEVTSRVMARGLVRGTSAIVDGARGCLKVLVLAVAAAATAGHPFQHTGRQGLYERREQLPQALRTPSKRDCETFGRKLLNEGRIVKCAPATGGKSKNWLDVPDGPFAKAEDVLLPGHYEAV